MAVKIDDVTFLHITPWVHECEECRIMCTSYVMGVNTHGKAVMYNLPCGCWVGPGGGEMPEATLALIVLALA